MLQQVEPEPKPGPGPEPEPELREQAGPGSRELLLLLLLAFSEPSFTLPQRGLSLTPVPQVPPGPTIGNLRQQASAGVGLGCPETSPLL